MASLKYFIKGTGNPTTIYLRFTHGRKFDFKRSTSLLINPKYWNVKKGTVKQVAEFKDKKNLQNDLNDLNNHILNSFNDDYASGKIINSDWLNTSIDSFFNQLADTDYNYFVDYANFFKENLRSKVQRNGNTGVTNSTILRYDTIINKVLSFEKFKKKRLTFDNINFAFYNDFKNYLITNENLNLNTTGRYINYVKTICMDAKKYGIKISPDIENGTFLPPSENVTFVTLSENEINKIFEYNFSSSPYLDNARNWLIIGVWTGARVSDLLRFRDNNIKNGFIEYTAKKTGQKIVLPLHPQVVKILANLNGKFPRSISSQRFNDYIKDVCKKVGITETVKGSKRTEIKEKVWRKVKGEYPKWELVSSHICRRSFATNHYGKLPTPVLMAITGHKTEKMFLNYIGKTAKDNAEVLNNFWQLQDKKKNQKTELKILKTGTNE